MKRALSLMIVLCLIPPPVKAQQRGFTLEQVLSSPFPTELIAAPTGGHVAWSFYDRGVRNIWVAGPPDYGARPVTSYSADDGQDISQLAFAPDGRAIIYVRGRPGANPLSVPEGVEQAIWIVSVDGGQPRRLAEGYAPALSPRGDQVAFLRQGEVWTVPLDGSKPPERLFRARGRASSLVWSPDGARLAFVSQQGQFAFGTSSYSFVGVYDLSAKRITWLDPSVYRDFGPAWSPDGRQVAFVRQRPAPRRTTGLTLRRSGEPWSIRVADALTGQGREIFRALPGRGSTFENPVRNPFISQPPIFWAAGDRIVFPWEKDGWTHLYSISAGGGEPVLLTPGEYEVEHIALSPLRDYVVYSSNEGDLDRRHLWRVLVSGGKRDLLTPGTGVEWAPVVANEGNVLAFFRSDAKWPARPALMRPGQEPRDLALETMPGDFPSTLLVEPQPVTITATDGVKSRGYLFLPRESAPGQKRPAVIHLHGGPWRQQLLGWCYEREGCHDAYAFSQYLASRGYVVLSLNYRGSIGYGLDFREAATGWEGASEYNDVLAAGRYLRARTDVDPTRIGLWGSSWGGYLTALGLARNSDLFAAGVDLSGAYDWVLMWSGMVVPVTSDETAKDNARDLALHSSPIAAIDSWRSPVLVIHGGDDRSVDFEQAVMLAEDLRARGVEVETLVHPDEAHGFLVHRHLLQAYRAAAEFLDRRVGTARPTGTSRIDSRDR